MLSLSSLHVLCNHREPWEPKGKAPPPPSISDSEDKNVVWIGLLQNEAPTERKKAGEKKLIEVFKASFSPLFFEVYSNPCTISASSILILV